MNILPEPRNYRAESFASNRLFFSPLGQRSQATKSAELQLIQRIGLWLHKSYARNQILEEAGVNFIISDFGNRHIASKVLCELMPDILVLSAAKGLCKNILEIDETDIIEVTNNTFSFPLVWITEAIKYLRNDSKIGWISSLTAKVSVKCFL